MADSDGAHSSHSFSHQHAIAHVALVGNPNSGKSTVFNQLTGLRQRTGNFPGITVDIKEGKLSLPSGAHAVLTDLPGTYSLYPTSSDEKIIAAVLADPTAANFPDAIIYVANATHLEKHLLLLTQILDLGVPVVCALNMTDVADAQGIKINAALLAERLKIPVVPISGRTGKNIQRLIGEVEKLVRQGKKTIERAPFYPLTEEEKQLAETIRLNLGIENPYRALLAAHHRDWLPHLNAAARDTLAAIVQTKNFQSLRAQVDETLDRYDRFTPLVQEAVQTPPPFPSTPTDRLDAVLTHRIWGPLIFVATMLLVFQAIYDWSSVPMDFIENQFISAEKWLRAALPDTWFSDLLTEGILAGLGGIVVFVPQIAILFFLVSILEEVGYMARVVFMFDRIMRRFGMNGRSVVSLISGGACAVPAIMSSRTIGNWQERLITVLVTPFISCSARIPVYAVLIGLAVPAVRVGGVFNLQSLVFASLYALGVVAALASGYLLKKVLRRREPSFLAIELPEYRAPHWKNVALTVWEKVGAFVVGAGKIILVISVVLWAMARFGPGDAMAHAEQDALNTAIGQQLDSVQTGDLVAARRLEASWAGTLGKTIEPAIEPLGYDWKIGIALITSFAAREVFVGTMATIYSIESAGEDDALLREQMHSATRPGTGQPVYGLATALSLLVFYALAMQCMSTLAVVRRETGSWKWALLQFVFMSALAYGAAWGVFATFSA